MTILAYRACGVPGPTPPLVMLHGLGEDASSWRTVTPLLADLGRIYLPDLRGHGDSPHPGTYSVELMLHDVVGLLDELGLDQITLVGHSMGAVVAYLLAHAHPQRVSALVLEEPPPPYPMTRPPLTAPDEPTPYDWAAVVAIRSQIERADPAWWDMIAEITVPTLVIAGGPESHLAQYKIAEMAARLPAGQLTTIPGGHDVHNAYPAEYADAVRRFLATPRRRQPTSTAVTA